MFTRSQINKQKLQEVYGEAEKIIYYDSTLKLTSGAYRQVNFNPNGVLRLTSMNAYHTLNPYLNSLNVGIYQDRDAFRSTDYNLLLLPNSSIEVVKVPDLVDLFTPTLNKFMPNRYHINRTVNNKIVIYLYYPELTITNSIGESHIIYDLVVKLVGLEDILNTEIRGFRYSYTKKEILYKYTHSHLPRDKNETKFCLGDTSPFRQFVNKLGSLVLESDVELFLTYLESYLIWESKEGAPYISISNFYLEQVADVTPQLSQKIVNDIATIFINNLKPEHLTQVNDCFILDPGLLNEDFFNLELRITDDIFSSTSFGYNYNIEMNCYLSNEDEEEDEVNLPLLSAEQEELIPIFGIRPRIVEEQKQIKDRSNIVRRLSNQDLSSIFNKVNSLLLQLHEPNKKQAEMQFSY